MQDMCVFDSSPLSTFRVMREKLDDRMQGSWWQGYGNDELNALVDEAAGTADVAARPLPAPAPPQQPRTASPRLNTSRADSWRFRWVLIAGGRLYRRAVELLQEDPAWLTLYHHTQCVGMGRPGVAVGECVGTDGVLDVRRLPA